MRLGYVAGVLVAGLALAAGNAQAEAKKSLHQQFGGQGYGTAGCGLGSIVFGQEKGLVQVVAATVNGTFYSQTFGVTSGTSNCDAGMASSKSASLSVFVAANRAAMQKDAARGQGETLATVSQILGCSNSAQVGSALQNNFKNVFGNSQASDEAVATEIMNTVAAQGGCSA